MFNLSTVPPAPSPTATNLPTHSGLPNCPPTDWMELGMCDKFDAKNALNLCIDAPSSIKKDVLKAILKTMRSGTTVKNYITFVLSYLEGFRINVQFSESLTQTQGQKPDYLGQYQSVTKTLILRYKSLEDISDPLFNSLIRHEFRHAYWHTLNERSLYKGLTFETDIVYPKTAEKRKQVLEHIKKGNQLINEVELLLKKEQAHTLAAKEREKLTKFRRACGPINYDYYPYYLHEANQMHKSWFVGQTISGNIGGLFVEFKVSSIAKNSLLNDGGHAHLSHLETLAFVVMRMKQNLLNMKHYDIKGEKYCREFDASLHESLPESIIAIFYPEFVNYIKNLESKVMHTPSPQDQHRLLAPFPPMLSRSGFFNFEFDNALTDELFLIALLRTFHYDESYMISKIASVLSAYRSAIDSGQLFQLSIEQRNIFTLEKQERSLNFHIKNGILVSEAKRLLGRIASIRKINSQRIDLAASGIISKYYHESFDKKGVEFDLFDHIDYIDSLLEINNIGDAKIVTQKALQRFIGETKLESRWHDIRKLQKGRMDPLTRKF